MVGGVVSFTVKVVVQGVLLPEQSVTVKVIGYEPTVTSVPEIGLWVTVTLPPQLSVALTRLRKSGTAARQLPFALALCPGGHKVICGTVVSRTLITWIVVPVRLHELRAVQERVIVLVFGQAPAATESL